MTMAGDELSVGLPLRKFRVLSAKSTVCRRRWLTDYVQHVFHNHGNWRGGNSDTPDAVQ